MTEARRAGSFSTTWSTARSFDGWLTEQQARLLWDCARALPDGAHVLEIGSHQGRSTTVLASAIGDRAGRVTAIDPFDDTLPPGHEVAKQSFEEHLCSAGVRDLVNLLTDFSTRLRPGWTEPIDLLYIDGEHGYHTVKDDLLWADHVPPGATVLIHDAFSSLGVTRALVTKAIPARHLRYRGRVGSLAHFEVGRPTAWDTVRLIGQLGWFARNVMMKVLITAGLGRVARALGHRQGSVFPY